MRAEPLIDRATRVYCGEEHDLARYVGKVLSCCPLIRSLWRSGVPAEGGANLGSAFLWDLIAFADMAALQRLRRSADLHRADVRLCVVTDGDHCESAWGALPPHGSLAGAEWQQTSVAEAFYNELASGVRYRRTRRRAVRLWHAVGADATTSVQ